MPTFRHEYERIAGECAQAGVDHRGYLLRLAGLEVTDRARRRVEQRIRDARFPVIKSPDAFDFTATPGLNRALALELACCNFVRAGENVILSGTSGAIKAHLATTLGLAACQRGFSVTFVTAAALTHRLQQAQQEHRLLGLLRRLAAVNLLIIDDLGNVPLSQTGADLLFEVLSQRHERRSTIINSNLPFEEWTSVFGREHLTKALIDRLAHRVHVLEMNGAVRNLTPSQTQRRHRFLDDPDGVVAPQGHEIHNASPRPQPAPQLSLRRQRHGSEVSRWQLTHAADFVGA